MRVQIRNSSFRAVAAFSPCVVLECGIDGLSHGLEQDMLHIVATHEPEDALSLVPGFPLQ
jgi:hypothetical protein